MSEGFYFANWRLWCDPKTYDVHLIHSEEEITFRMVDLDGLLEMLVRLSNTDLPEHRRVHSTEENIS